MFFKGFRSGATEKDSTENNAIEPIVPIVRTKETGPDDDNEASDETGESSETSSDESSGSSETEDLNNEPAAKPARSTAPKAPAIPDKLRLDHIFNDKVLQDIAKERQIGYQLCCETDLITKLIKRDGAIDLICNKWNTSRKTVRSYEYQIDDLEKEIKNYESAFKSFQTAINVKDNSIKKLEKDLYETKYEYSNNNDTIDADMISAKCDIYYNLFIRLYDKLTITKKRLDLYQNYLKTINSLIQLSVITLSIASSFIQALDSKTYEIFFNADSLDTYNNISEIAQLTNHNSDIKESNYSSIVSIVTLSVSTYSALVIAAERHFSFQQRETNVEKLKESYTEPINRIRSNLELLRPWRYTNYYMKNGTDRRYKYVKDYTTIQTNYPKQSKKNKQKYISGKSLSDYSIENDTMSESSDKIETIHDSKETKDTNLQFDDDRKKEWFSTVGKLDREYSHVVDVKKELDTSLEKMIGVKILKNYQRPAPRKIRDEKLKNIKLLEKHANKDRFIYNWCCCVINHWFCCKRKEVNHTYDEDDMNYIEDIIDTKILNKQHTSGIKHDKHLKMKEEV